MSLAVVRIAVLAAAIATLAATSVRAQETESAEERMQRLDAGEILVTATEVPGRTNPRVHAVAVIQAPPERVWAIVQDCGNYSRTMPRVLDSSEVERDGGNVRCRQTIDMPFPFSDLPLETQSVHTVVPGVSYRREWKLREGEFEVNEGSWTLVPHAGGASTLATYDALMEPKVPLPAWIVNSAAKITLPSMIEGLRKQVTRQ